MSDFGPHPTLMQIRDLTLSLGRMTRWGMEELLSLAYDEAEWWLEGANALEEEIAAAMK